MSMPPKHLIVPWKSTGILKSEGIFLATVFYSVEMATLNLNLIYQSLYQANNDLLSSCRD